MNSPLLVASSPMIAPEVAVGSQEDPAGRLGRQPNASYRSAEDGSLPLVAQSGANIASNRAITDVGPAGRWLRVSPAIRSFNGEPEATAFRDLYELCDADAFGLPLNDGLVKCHRAKRVCRRDPFWLRSKSALY